MKGHVLVAEDNPVNRRLLVRTLLAEGFSVTEAEDGEQAIERLRTAGSAVDIVLLDIMMPTLDGYDTLRLIKADPSLQHMPVLMISAIEEIDSVVRCIRLGAADYLPKPFNGDILRARLDTSLASKRLRDRELEYLEQVGKLTVAASEVESGAYEAARLDSVSQRDDELGNLARVFQRMVAEVRSREERLTRQVEELRIEIDEGRQARKVAEITETDFYRRLSADAVELREMMDKPPE